MERIKLLHFADLHLDMPFTSLSDSGIADTRRHEVRLAFRRIIALAREEAVNLLLAAGDLFEHGYAGKSSIQLLIDEFGVIPDINVIVIPGNHDPYVQDSPYHNCCWPANVHILDGSQKRLEIGRSAVVYCGLPDAAPDRNMINILLLHATVGMDPDGRAFNPYTLEKLEDSGMDYIALGHFHNRIEGTGRQGRIFNPGSPEPLGFDEEGAHGVFIAAIEKENGICNVNSSFVPVGRRSYVNMAVRLDRCATDEQAAEKAAAALEGLRPDDLYCMTLAGTTAEGFRINRNRVAGYLKGSVFFIKIKDETVPAYDLEEIAGEPGLKGLFTRKMLARAGNSVGADERELVMKALYYGLEAIEHGVVSADVY